jgi:hypothetical protein
MEHLQLLLRYELKSLLDLEQGFGCLKSVDPELRGHQQHGCRSLRIRLGNLRRFHSQGGIGAGGVTAAHSNIRLQQEQIGVLGTVTGVDAGLIDQ